MPRTERQEKILNHLVLHDELTVEAAMRLFRVSIATARRDFAELTRAGSVERYRGGIRQKQAGGENILPYTLRHRWFAEEKFKLARKAVEFLTPGEVLFIDGGSTTSFLAGHLPPGNFTVITNSLPLVSAFERRFPGGGGPELFLAGGRIQLQSGLLLGPNAEANIRQYHADWLITSARGITAKGLFNNNEMIAGLERTMLENARRVMVLADHSKIGNDALCQVCPVERIDLLITVETPENAAELEAIRQRGCRIVTI